MHGKEIGLAEVARVLGGAGVNYVVVGAHAANGYTGKPRTTVDVNIIVQFPKRAAKAVADAFPHLEMRDTPVVIRFSEQGEDVIELMKPTGSPLWARLLKKSRELVVGDQQVRIPILEGILAGKFAAMASPLRQFLDKQQDAIDFSRICVMNQNIDLRLLAEFGELVYSGGGPPVVKLVEDAKAGRRLEF